MSDKDKKRGPADGIPAELSGAPLAEDQAMLTIREAAEGLDIGEDELWDLVHKHKVPTHNVAGAFLRFHRHDIEDLKIKWRIQRELFPAKEERFPHKNVVTGPSFFEKLSDFWYFNDFYILCSMVIVSLVYFIVVSQ